MIWSPYERGLSSEIYYWCLSIMVVHAGILLIHQIFIIIYKEGKRNDGWILFIIINQEYIEMDIRWWCWKLDYHYLYGFIYIREITRIVIVYVHVSLDDWACSRMIYNGLEIFIERYTCFTSLQDNSYMITSWQVSSSAFFGQGSWHFHLRNVISFLCRRKRL